MTAPITPVAAFEQKQGAIPAAVYDVVNALIVKHLDAGGTAVVLQEAIVASLEGLGYARADVYAARWLDFEKAYEAAGWRVRFERPGYNEDGFATFTFTSCARRASRLCGGPPLCRDPNCTLPDGHA